MNGDWHRYDAIVETYQPFISEYLHGTNLINMLKTQNPSPGPGQV